MDGRESGTAAASPMPLSSLTLRDLLVNEGDAEGALCSICHELLQHPRQCTDGHLFCHHCILRCLEKKHSCPICRQVLTVSDLCRNRFAEDRIALLRVHCRWHFRLSGVPSGGLSEPVPDLEAGCPLVVTAGELDQHEQACEHRPVRCKHAEATCIIRANAATAHAESCEWRPTVCPHCHAQVIHKDLMIHVSACDEAPVQCEECSWRGQRRLLSQHRSSCPDALVPCLFADQGCGSRIRRRDMEQHLAGKASSHMMLLRKAFESQVHVLTQDFRAHLSQKEHRIRLLEQRLDALGQCQPCVVHARWSIPDYSRAQQHRYLQSQPFTMAGCRWFLGWYPAGDADDEPQDGVTVYLFLDDETTPPRHKIKLDYHITLVNHASSRKNITQRFVAVFPLKGGSGWGKRNFVKSSRLVATSGFLPHDTLTVEIQIVVKATTWRLAVDAA